MDKNPTWNTPTTGPEKNLRDQGIYILYVLSKLEPGISCDKLYELANYRFTFFFERFNV